MKLLALDFEGYYDKDVSLRKLNTMEYVNHPKFKVTGCAARWVGEEDKAIWFSEDEVQDFLDSVDWGDTAILCHNSNFDAYVLAQHYGKYPAFHYDTMAMCRGRWPAQSASLEHMLLRLFPDDETLRKGTELASAKGIETYSPELDEIIGAYACNDVDTMVAAFEKMLPDYPPEELKLIDILCRMFTQSKFRLDRAVTVKHRNDAKASTQDKVTSAGIDRKVLSSNDQFADYLRNVLKIEPPMKQGKKKLIPAFGKNDLAFQALQKQYPEHKAIWDARVSAKSRIDETRAGRLLDGTNKDGTLPVPLRYSAAHTHRFGGAEKLNLQNLRRGSNLRKALLAPDGYMVVVVDKSQIEARIVAWLAGCDKLTEAFREKRDIYCEFGNTVYGRTITKADATERFVCKTSILSLQYGVGHKRLRDVLESGAQGPVVIINEQEARRIVNAYRAEFREIPELWNKLEAAWVYIQNPKFFGTSYGPMVATRDTWTLPGNPSLVYPNTEGMSFYDSRYKMRKKLWGGHCLENWGQYLARCDIVRNMILLDTWFKENPHMDGMVSLQIHDEIICIVKEEYAQQTLHKMLSIMTTPPAWAPDLPLGGEGGFAREYSK